MIHELKTWPQYFVPMWEGRKTFEIRKNDRNYQVGDTLILKEWYTDTGYSGRSLAKRVTYVLHHSGWLQDGYVVMSLVDGTFDGTG